jgi:hypothetical protein
MTHFFVGRLGNECRCVRELYVNFREFLSIQIIKGDESKIEGVVSKWVEVVDIVGSRCHHAMCVDVIASEPPIISMVDVTPS